MPIAKADAVGPLIRRLQQSGVERIAIDRGVTRDEITAFLDAVDGARTRAANDEAPIAMPPTSPTSGSAASPIEQRVEGSLADMAAVKRLYSDAVSVATSVWESASTEGKPDATMARTMVDGLAQAVAQNRTALLALTTLKNYDNYTFTHMVNVSILTMGQARGARHRRPAAARVRARGADARHRQGAHAARDPEQARQADRRRVHDHEAAYRRRRRDPAEDAGHPDARPGHRLRAPPAARRHRLPARRHAAVAERRHDVVQHCRRLRRDAVAAHATSRRSRPSGSSKS